MKRKKIELRKWVTPKKEWEKEISDKLVKLFFDQDLVIEVNEYVKLTGTALDIIRRTIDQEVKEALEGVREDLLGIEITLRRGDGELVAVQPALKKVQDLNQKIEKELEEKKR